MASTVHDTMLLDVDLAGILPVNGYHVHTKGHAERPYALTVNERSLTGQLQVHRIMTGASPYQARDWMLQLIVSQAEKAQLEADVGKVCYFMPNYRDDADVGTREVVHFETIQNVVPLDPMLTYYYVTVMLVDAAGLTVG